MVRYPLVNWSEVFTYSNGKLFWKIQPRSNVSIGDEAGWLDNCGYRRIWYKGKRFMSSAVIWELHNGPIPQDLEIDHKDRDSSNDKIENLRLATRANNLANMKGRGSLGLRGITWDSKREKYEVQVGSHLRKLRGRFKSLLEAKAAYSNWAKTLHGNFAYHHNLEE